MNTGGPNGQAKAADRLLLVAVPVFIAAIHLTWFLVGDDMASHGHFADGDSYTRLIRVGLLVDGAGWFDNSIPGADAPYGSSVHWARLFDLVLIAIALPMVPFLGIKAALHTAGLAVSPVLHLALALVLAWAARPLVGRAAALTAGGLTATQFGVMGFAIVGHADHHMMFPLLLTLAVGFLIRAWQAEDEGIHRPAFRAGAMLALALWVGPEMLIFLTLVFSVTGIAWLVGAPSAARLNLSLSAGLAATLVAVLLIERGSGFFEAEYDRVSVAHMTAAVIVLAFWAAVRFAEVRVHFSGTFWTRLLIGMIGDAIALSVLWTLFPDLLANPFRMANPELAAIYAQISEYGPIEDFPHFLVYAGSALFCVPWVIARLWRRRKNSTLWPWLLIALSYFVFLALTLHWLRWSLYAGLFASLLVADLAVTADGAINRRFRTLVRVPVKVLALLAILVGPLFLGTALVVADEEEEVEKPQCAVRRLAPVLTSGKLGRENLTVAASANFGAEIMYRTPHRVVATVHHRNARGILDSHRLFRAVNDRDIAGILEERGIDLLLICPGSEHDGYLAGGAPDGNLYSRLAGGAAPGWLREVALVELAAEGFRLFRVVAPPR